MLFAVAQTNARIAAPITAGLPSKLAEGITRMSPLRKYPRMRHARAALLALTLLAGAPSQAQDLPGWQPTPGHAQIPLWPGSPPGPVPAVGAETVHYAVDAATGARKLLGGKPYVYIENVSRPTLTIYPPKGSNSGAAVIVYPGGGFNVLAMDIEGTEACDWLTSIGISCVLLKYRVPCKHEGAFRECPQAHQDAQRAMALVRSRAGEWKIDPRRIGVMGFSAGAHMAIMSSTRFDRLYAAVDAADGVSSRPDFALVLYPGRMAYRNTNFAPNPDIRVTGKTPPTFLVHAYDDDMNPVENSLLYAAALRKAGVPAELHVYAQGGHAFGLRRTGVSASGWPGLAEAWLQAIGVIGEQGQGANASTP
jgi:acetyl esterase/lipase